MDVLRGSEKFNFVQKDDGIFVKNGQTLILWDGSNSGEIIKIEQDGILSSTMGVLNKIGNKLNDEFSFYQLKFHEPEIRNNTNGMGIPHVDGQYVRSLVLLFPPLQEQKLIVKYLDDKTSILDKLISIKEKKIQLLKEQRISLINEVITKGLDRSLEYKDSGIEWIGEIPKEWEIVKLKKIVDCNKRILSENTDPNYELKYIEIGDVNKYGEIKNMTSYLFKDSPSRCRRILSKGDVFISSVRTYLKSIGYVKNEISDVICSTGFCVLTPKLGMILPQYLFYQVLTEFFIGEVISKSVGVSYPSITSSELINIKIIHPPIIVQEKIVEYLDKYTKEIDDLVSMEQEKIDLLKEYRQSLISEVITGKIKVVK
jgi:type I restriction enzyme S subunit